MADLKESFKIRAGDFARAGEVSIKIQGILKTIGFDASLVRRVSICAYEAEMNVVMHGGDGSFLLTIGPEHIHLDVKDDGVGIEDVDLALQEGYSTASEEHREMGFGAGMGLPNIKKNADSLHVNSDKGNGTHLMIGFTAGKGDG
jgi:anti-sigma regulatory factor (Ser/Thr protein kinase)